MSPAMFAQTIRSTIAEAPRRISIGIFALPAMKSVIGTQNRSQREFLA